MLPKSQRLNLKKNFNWVASGQKISTQTLNIFYRFGENKKPLIGIATSKKVTPKAHERNYAKRIIFKTMSKLYTNLPNNLNLVIMPKGNILKISEKELFSELENIKYFNKGN